MERGRLAARSIPLWSEALGLAGRADVVEIDSSGKFYPVEYKIGQHHGDSAAVQLCAQALCLEEMTEEPVVEGAIWYSSSKRRERITIDESLRERTLDVIARVRNDLIFPGLPIAQNDLRCRECQLQTLCIPEIVADKRRLSQYFDEWVYSCP